MPREVDREYEEPEENDVTEDLPDDQTFRIGQSYHFRGLSATTISCKKCKSKAFNVGRCFCYAAIKCVNCDWQVCIYDG